jgi:hypothetical protein
MELMIAAARELPPRFPAGDECRLLNRVDPICLFLRSRETLPSLPPVHWTGSPPCRGPWAIYALERTRAGDLLGSISPGSAIRSATSKADTGLVRTWRKHNDETAIM